MSDVGNIAGSQGSQAQPTTTPVVQPDAQTAGLAATANQSGGTFNGSTKISNMNDLAAKAPQVEQAMLVGIAQTIVKDLRRDEERRKKLASEYKR